MSIYAVHKVCWLTQHDADFRRQMLADPAAAIADFRLTDAERNALLSGDLSTLALMGAHGYLLGHLQRHRLLGLNRDIYVERMRTAKLRQHAASSQREQ